MVLWRGCPLPRLQKELLKVGGSWTWIKKVQIYAQNAPKYVWWPGSARTRWGNLRAPSPDPLAAIEVVLFVLSVTVELVHHYIDS